MGESTNDASSRGGEDDEDLGGSMSGASASKSQISSD
jgi:hypothetical protein